MFPQGSRPVNAQLGCRPPWLGWGDGQWMRDWNGNARSAGVRLACESVICSEAHDEEANTAPEALAAALK